MTLVAEKKEKYQKGILDFYQGEVQQKELESMLHNPEKALNDANIIVEEIFKEAVILGLQEANQTFSKFQNQPILWNNNLLLNTGNGKESDLYFTHYPWGLVLELSHNATQYAIYGISLAASITSAIKEVSQYIPIAHVTESIVVAAYTSFLNNHAPTINTIDHGNGIYLIFTWPQIALSAGVLFPKPIAITR